MATLKYDSLSEKTSNARRTVFEVLSDYVQPNSTMSLDEAIDQTVPFYSESRTEYDPVQSILFHLAERTPADHPGQAKLANFFVGLGKSRKWVTRSRLNREDAEEHFYIRMSDMLFSEMWEPDHRLGAGEDPMNYVRACAFMANLILPELQDHEWMMYALGAMGDAMWDAFTLDISKEVPIVRDAFVMGAAQYIIWRAEKEFTMVEKPDDPEVQAVVKQYWPWQSRKKTEALRKKWIYTLDEWQTWESGFRDVARGDTKVTFGSECRTVAAQAADLMAAEEKRWANR